MCIRDRSARGGRGEVGPAGSWRWSSRGPPERLRRRVDGQDAVRADPGTECATRAGGRVDQADRVVAKDVHARLVESQRPLGAGPEAEAAPLAAVSGDVKRVPGPGRGAGGGRQLRARDLEPSS